MRFYTKQHKFYCGIDLHARMMYVCILDKEGNIVLHKNMKSGTDSFLGPFRRLLTQPCPQIFPRPVS